MQLSKGQIITVVIKEIAFGGDAVGIPTDETLTGCITFVKGGVLPGETAEVSLTRIKKNYLEAQLVKIVTESPSRGAPRCKHFGVCGGCSLQHLSYDKQLEVKDGFVRDALIKFGGFSADYLAEIKKPIIGCDDPWYYRNKTEYSFERGQIGFHPKGQFRDVFELEECFLQSPLAVKIVAAVRAWFKEKNLVTYNSLTHSGCLKNLIIREGKNSGEVLVNLVTTDDQFDNEEDFTELIRTKFPAVTSIYRTVVAVRRGFKTVNTEKLLWGKPTLLETLTVGTAKLNFEILPQAFFQPNTIQAQRLYADAIICAKPDKNDHVLDLFCGTGTIGMFCAQTGCKVTGIDVSDSAIENAHKNALNNGLDQIEFHVGDTGKQLKKLQEKAQTATVLITDPPRSGIDPKTLEKIIALQIPRWVYVSCNPTTLARDLKIACATMLPNGKKYVLKHVQPVDMFPQTYHVETVTLLEATPS